MISNVVRLLQTVAQQLLIEAEWTKHNIDISSESLVSA